LTITIAILILILALAFVGWTMTKSKDMVKFPQLQNTCPDYWTVNASGHCEQPTGINKGNKTLTADSTRGITATDFDPNHAGWSAAGDAVCAKKKWASDLGITWDTITNANYC
jgi:hypothetical protein